MKSLKELEAIRNKMLEKVDIRKNDAEKRIVVGMATCGIAAGARPVLQAFVDDVATRGLSDVVVSQTGCIGVCRLEPIAEVFLPGQEKVTYVKMTPEKAKKVVAEHIVNGNIVTEYTIGYAEQNKE
ncbi:MAG: (2Fe-2S) ferredoxin domain-containing protein [Christensenella sp.]|nr:(2Fe-2S) ferredoxin domain-containing protein [Christensenella sp.]